MREQRPTQGEGRAAVSSPSNASTHRNTGGVAELAQLINAADRVTFLCGAGCAHAREELLQLAQRVQAPMAYTLAAKEVLEADNPMGVGMIGPLGWGDARQALLQADLLVLWGTNFPFRHHLPQQGRVVQVDHNPAAVGRRVPVCLGVVGDVAVVARQLLPLVHQDRPEEHLCRSLARHGRELSAMHATLSLPPDAPVSAAYLTRLVSDMAEPDAVFCIGLGAPLRWAARYLQARVEQRLFPPVPMESLIGELRQARRCKESEPSRQVIAFCGDEMRETICREMPALHHDGLAIKVLLYAHSSPHPDELRYGEALEMVEHAPSAVRRWLRARRAALLAGLVPMGG